LKLHHNSYLTLWAWILWLWCKDVVHFYYTHYLTMTSKKSNWISNNNNYIYDLLTRKCVLMSKFSFLQQKIITQNAKVISFVFTCWNKCRGHQIEWQIFVTWMFRNRFLSQSGGFVPRELNIDLYRISYLCVLFIGMTRWN
jgi:hypothetical protein